jgi:hypothetical protein
MAKRLHYGSHSFGGYYSLCPNWCKVCNATNPSLPGTPLPEKCASCGSPFPPIEERWTPAIHTNPDAAKIPQTHKTTGTEVKEIQRQQRVIAKWKEMNERERKV